MMGKRRAELVTNLKSAKRADQEESVLHGEECWEPRSHFSQLAK